MDIRAQHEDGGAAASGQAGGSTAATPQTTGVLSTAASTVHDVLERAENAAADAANNKVQPVVSRLPQSAQAPLYEAVHAAADAATSLREGADDVMARQEAMLQSATRYVQANPLQSVGIAVAAGWLIGRITR